MSGGLRAPFALVAFSISFYLLLLIAKTKIEIFLKLYDRYNLKFIIIKLGARSIAIGWESKDPCMSVEVL